MIECPFIKLKLSPSEITDEVKSLSYTLHALKGQKPLAQGNALGYHGRKLVAL